MRERNVIHTRCPVVRSEDGPWARWTDLSGGADVMGRVDFRATVAWVRETLSRTVVRYADGSVGEGFGSTYNDYHGYASSVGDVVDDARRVSLLLATRPGSAVTVEARCRVQDVPLLPEPGQRPLGNSLPYLSLPEGWSRPDDPWLDAMARADRDGSDDWLSVPDRVTVRALDVADVLIWTSAMPDAPDPAGTLLDAAHATLVRGLPADALEPFRERWSRWRSALWRDAARDGRSAA